MKIMHSIPAIRFLLASLLLVSASLEAQKQQARDGRDLIVARSWLALLDKSQWDAAVGELKGDLPKDYFRENLPRWRGAIGAISGRKFVKRTQSAAVLVADTVVKSTLEFATSPKGSKAVWTERVILERVTAGPWHVVAYELQMQSGIQ
jgi:hypothetical protein